MSNNKDHNKGQADAANGKYDPPIGLAEQFFTWSPSKLKSNSERNGDYKAGYQNGSKQK